MAGRVAQSLRKYFITGVLVSLPLVVTIYVLWFTFSFLDSLFGRLITFVFARTIPGAGTALTVVLLLLIGMFAANVLGRRLIEFGERILLTIPLVRPIYHSVKQVIDAFTLQGHRGSFRRVVMIEYPRRGVYALAFVTNDSVANQGFGENGNLGEEDGAGGDSEGLVAVFVPTTPNPTSGFILMLPKDELIPVDMSVEQAFKMVISGGILAPERRSAEPVGAGAGVEPPR